MKPLNLMETLPFPEKMKHREDSLFAQRPIVEIESVADLDEYKELLLSLMRLKREDSASFNKITGDGDYLRQLADKIKSFEDKKYGAPRTVSGVKLLAFLMEQNSLTQSDFQDEIGPQSNVSAILSGKRNLSLEHIDKLSQRFAIAPERFFTK